MTFGTFALSTLALVALVCCTKIICDTIVKVSRGY